MSFLLESQEDNQKNFRRVFLLHVGFEKKKQMQNGRCYVFLFYIGDNEASEGF